VTVDAANRSAAETIQLDEVFLADLALEFWRAVATVRRSEVIPDDERAC
jgi:hypothetical protein